MKLEPAFQICRQISSVYLCWFLGKIERRKETVVTQTPLKCEHFLPFLDAIASSSCYPCE